MLSFYENDNAKRLLILKLRTVLTENTDDFIIGDRVWVNGTKPGYIQYLGETRFSPGDWAGVVLDDHSGKNDGSVAGIRYFQCEPKRGVFARLHKLTRYPLLNVKDTSPSTPPTCVTPTQRCLTPTRTPSPGLAGRVREGDRVIVASANGAHKTGTLRYIGITDFATGEWAGVELDEPLGKNDGTVAGKRYFRCSPNYGLFSPLHKVSRCSGTTHRHRKIETNNFTTRDSEQTKELAALPSSYQVTDQQGMDERSRVKLLLEAAEAEKRRLLSQLEDERRKVEELEFRVDEMCIHKDDLEVEHGNEKKKIAELEKQLKEEKKKNEMIANGANPDSIIKDEVKRLKEELTTMRQKLQEVESKKSENQFRSISPSGRSIRDDMELRRKDETLMQAQLSLDNKKREVQNLLTRISEMEKELQKHKSRQQKQLDVIDDLNVRLQKSESKCVDLSEELHNTKEKLEETERKLKNTMERLDQLEAEKSSLEQQISAPPEEASLIPALNARIQDRDRQLEAFRLEAETERNESREKWKKELDDKIKNLNAEHREEMQREKKRAQKTEEDSAKRIHALEKIMESQRVELESMRAESETVRIRLQEADLRLEDIGKMADQVGRLQAERDLLQVEKEETWKRLQVSEESRKRAEREAQRASDEVHSLKSQVNRLRTEFTTYREDLVKKLAQTEFDSQVVLDLRSQIESQRRIVEEVQSRLRKTEGEKDQLQRTLSNRQIEQGQIESTSSELRQEIDSLKRRLSDAENDRENVSRRLEGTQKLLEKQRIFTSRQVSLSSETDEEKAQLQNKIDSLQNELTCLKNENLTLNSVDQKRAKSEKDALEQQVHFLNSVIVDMQHKNDDLKSRLEILETQVIFDGHLNLGVPSRSTSRLYCDICNSFDYHDTEDCPKQLSSFVRRQLSYSSQESEF